MRKKIRRKNNILSAITGGAIGSILAGISILNWQGAYQQAQCKIAAVIMIVVGVVWLILFTIANRKKLFKKF
jgi:hypothetical protein